MADNVIRVEYQSERARAYAADLLGQARASGRLEYGPTYDRAMSEHYDVLARFLLWADRDPSCTSTGRALAHQCATMAWLLADPTLGFTHDDIAQTAALLRWNWQTGE